MTHWVTSWATASNGIAAPLPLQPDLAAAFGGAPCRAQDQCLRMILRPSLIGEAYRLRISNRYGDHALRIGRATAAVQAAAAALHPGSVRPVTFGGAPEATITAGERLVSDAFTLPPALLQDRNLAISLHLRDSGSLTWHADAFATSYLSAPLSGDQTACADEAAFPYATTSWLLVEALDVAAAPGARAIVALGDSITDGWITTVNGHDRWTDILARRLSSHRPGRYAVVNQGLCGNRVTAGDPFNPSALDRVERDVASLAGLGALILFDGTNDLGSGVPPDEIIRAMRAIIAKAHDAGLPIFGATLLPRGIDAPLPQLEEAEYLRAWRRVNAFIRTGGAFDGVLDFAAVLCGRDDPDHLDPAYIPNPLGPGDGLHPNRLAHLRLAESIPLSLFDGRADLRIGGRSDIPPGVAGRGWGLV